MLLGENSLLTKEYEKEYEKKAGCSSEEVTS